MRILSLLLFMGALSLGAQTTTTTTTKTQQTSSSNVAPNNMMASNIHTNNGKVDSHSSTSETRYSFKFIADFKDYKQQDIKQALMSHLNDQDLTLKNGTYTWQLENADGVYFNCKLTEGTLSFHLDKTIAPAGSLRKAEALSDNLVAIISAHASIPYQSHDPQLSRQISNGSNKAELQQALRELEAARRKVERLGKKVNEERKN